MSLRADTIDAGEAPRPDPATPALPGASRSGALSLPAAGAEGRLRALRVEHFEFVWRSVRRLGVADADADDAVQQIFITAAAKLDSIVAGSERSFLFGIALRVASHARRTVRRRGEVLGDAIDERADVAPGPDDLLEQRRARALLDEVLDALPLDVRAVFILFEMEELSLSEIAEMLAIPQGTAASRLRRGRERFQEQIARIEARQAKRVR
jgi:RNA polymerase sigma-70 factor (ECF subfamily)